MAASTPRDVHFLACVHGMWGVPTHLSSIEKEITKRYGEDTKGPELVTLLVKTSADSFTYDGLDWCAERAVKEIYETIEEIEKDGSKKVTLFSIFGYSLGGLISRYALGVLYKRGFFDKVKPVNFTTFATPHIGLPRFRGVVGGAMHKLGPIMLSRTGRQFYCVDDDMWSADAKEGKPLIAVMADKDSIFFKALSLFPHMTIYGNAVHDLTVTYCSSMIEPHDPFTELSAKNSRLAVKMDPEYKHVIQSFFKVPEGEAVPLHELEKARRAERDAIAWYKPSRYRTGRPWIPPFLKLPFPLNLLFYVMAPFLIPLGLTYAAIRFRRESAGSRKRLAELTASPEADSSLSTLMRKMEQAVERAIDSDELVADDSWEVASDLEEGSQSGAKKRKGTRADTPEGDKQVELLRGAGSLPSPVATPGSRTPLERADPITSTKSKSKPAEYPQLTLRTTPDPSDPAQPVLTPTQLEMIESLNSIPQMKKVRAFFPFARNAHSMIIARDPEKFPFHMVGFEVIRHWADRFVLEDEA